MKQFEDKHFSLAIVDPPYNVGASDGNFGGKLKRPSIVNGKINGKRAQQCYDIGDNDYYWLNADDKQLFYVFPEQILIEKGYIGYKGKKQLKINPKETTHNGWIQPYKFNYNSIGLFEKNRLLNILNI